MSVTHTFRLLANPPRSRATGKRRRIARGYWKVTLLCKSKAEAMRLERYLSEMRAKGIPRKVAA